MKRTMQVDGKKYILEWFDSVDFKKLKPVRQVYGYIFDKKGRLLLTNPKTTWRLAGGTTEKYDKTPIETLIRETDEEADVEIKDIEPLGYLKITSVDENGKIHYALRYVAKIKKIKPQTPDVAIGEIGERKFIAPEKFSDYCDWGEMGLIILDKAIKKYKELNEGK